MGGGVSTDFKSSNRIEISRLVQVLLNFDWFWGSPQLGVGGGWMGVGGGEREHPTNVHMHAHARTCTHAPARTRARTPIWHHREFPGIPPMGVAICMKLSCLPHVHVCACMCVHACACAHVWGAPPNHPPPHPTSPPSPEPQGAQNTKIQ